MKERWRDLPGWVRKDLTVFAVWAAVVITAPTLLFSFGTLSFHTPLEYTEGRFIIGTILLIVAIIIGLVRLEDWDKRDQIQ